MLDFLIHAAHAATACPSGSVCLTNPLGTVSVPQFIGHIIQAVMGIVGSVTLLVFIYGGFMWLTSAGDPKKVETGKQAMVYASIGILIIFSAAAIVQLVFNGFSK